MAKQKPSDSLAEVLRAAIRDSGKSVYAVAKESGVAQPILHRFMAEERDLTLDTADVLCRYFSLRLTPIKS